MDGHYGKALCMLFFALVRAIEMPLLSVSFYLAFLGLEATTGYETYALWSLLLQVASGFIVWWSMCATYMLSGWLAEGVTVNLRKRVLRSLLFRPAAFFERTSPAACISSVSHDAPNCAGAMDFNISQNISNFCSVVYHLAVTFFISWAMGVLGIGLCGLLYFLIFASMFLGNMARNAKSKNDKSGEFSIEVAEKAQTIQLLAVEARFVKKFEEYQSQARCYDIWVNCADAFNHAMCNSYVYFNDICCMALGTQLTFIGTTTVDLAFFAFSQVQFAGWSVMYTGPFLPDMIRASGAARHVFRFIDTDRRISETQTAGVKPYIDGKLTLSSVNFAYPSRPDQLVTKSLSMDVEPGENVALVGPSGCGKSTIVGLLEAFYSPQSGKIKLGKHLIEDINLPHLRKTIGLVEQEPVLFKGTIYENVALGADDVTIEDVMNACKAANCKFISAFPQGYETDVGEGGKALSGGQKQRIAIARMLVRKPKIILLDEATSALDTESEKTVQKALAEASVGRTSITIAHRLATIQKCDRIFFVDNGHVVECGTHEELLAQDGQYAQLVKVQILT